MEFIYISKQQSLLKPVLFLLLCLNGYQSSAAVEAEQNLYELPLSTLLNVIVSASKTEEFLLDSPLSANILTREQIERSGATTIPELFRLVPGLIVREQTNGNFDVHIRGLGNIPPDSEVVRTSNNNLTLVMVDNQVVYNHFTGGTFWEQLAINVHDIEKIEIVKGATAAMYGPNAVTGVIHIFTKQPDTEGRKHHISVLQANQNSRELNASSSFGLGQFNSRVSAYLQERGRHDKSYYEFLSGARLSDPADIETLPQSPGGSLPDPYVKYPDVSNAMERYGIHYLGLGTWLNNAKAKVQLSYQESQVQKVYDDNAATPLTTVDSDAFYLNLASEWEHITARLQAEQGSSNVLGSPFFSFDYRNTHAQLEGDFTVNKLKVQPLIHFTHRKYGGESFSGDARMDVISFGLRSEYQLEQLRLVGALRSEYYDYSRDVMSSYSLSATYKFDDNLIFRASLAHAKQEPFMLTVFEDLMFPNTDIRAVGNEDIKVVEADNFEIGIRYKLATYLGLDIELFRIESKNYQALTGENFPVFQFNNLEDTAEMHGLTASLNFDKESWQSSVFWTQQNTQLDNAIVDFNPNTPKSYGGLSVNYNGFDRLNANFNAYYFSKSAQYNVRTLDTSSGSHVVRPEGKVKGKSLFNAKVSYQITKANSVFLNVRNLLNDESREFAMADKTGALYFVGLNSSF